MGLCVSGVSGGFPVGPTPATPAVAPLLGGVPLSLVGDYATIFVSNAAKPGGPDVSGIFALSGTAVGAGVRVDFVPDPTNYATGNWQVLNGVIRNDTNAFVSGPFTVPTGTALQINPGNVSSLYAIRLFLVTAPTSGTLLASGNTNPGSVAGVDNAILSQQLAIGTLMKAVALGLSDLTGVDYVGAVGGSY